MSSEHDITKEMLNIIRYGSKKFLKEEDEGVIDVTEGDSLFKDELTKLQNIVDPRVRIDNFKIYPNDENVIIDGVFLQREMRDSGIHFTMSLSAGELETSMNNVELNDKVNLLLQKLRGYYENWVDEWALKIVNEYKFNND